MARAKMLLDEDDAALAELLIWHFKREDFDKMLHEARSELDDTKRKALYHSMALMVRDEGGLILPVSGLWSVVGLGAGAVAGAKSVVVLPRLRG